MEAARIPLALSLLFYGILAICLAAVLFKALLLSALSTAVRFQSVDVQRVPRLDGVALQKHTDQFLKLGFVWLGDITNTAGIAVFNAPPGEPIPAIGQVQDSHNKVPGFCRVFAHPVHGYLAEAYQHFPPNAPNPPLKLSVCSLLTNGWDVTTSNRRAEAIPYILRRARGVRTTHREAEAWKLVGAHEATCQRIMRERGQSVVALSRLEDYVEQEQRVMAEYKEALKARSPFGVLWEALTFNLAPKTEWMGDPNT